MGGWVGGFARRDYGDFRDLLVPEVFRTLVFLTTFVDVLASIAASVICVCPAGRTNSADLGSVRGEIVEA